MPVAAGISAAGSVAAGGLGLLGSIFSSNQAAQGQKNALAAEEGMFGQGMNLIQPFVNFGQSVMPQLSSAYQTLQNLLTPGPNQSATLSQLPGFQFAVNTGSQALANAAPGTTGLGGNFATALQNFGIGTAQQGFGSLVNLLQNFAGGLQNTVNTGAGAASSALSGAIQAGGQIGGTAANLGNTLASGISSGTNALTGAATSAASGAANYLGLNALLSKLNPTQAANPGIYGGNVLESQQVAAGNPVL